MALEDDTGYLFLSTQSELPCTCLEHKSFSTWLMGPDMCASICLSNPWKLFCNQSSIYIKAKVKKQTNTGISCWLTVVLWNFIVYKLLLMPQLVANCAGMGGNGMPLIFSLLSSESNLDLIFPVAKPEVGCIQLLTKCVCVHKKEGCFWSLHLHAKLGIL